MRCFKNIKRKAIFNNTEMNNEWNIYFLHNSLMAIKKNATLLSFPLVKAPLKCLFWYGMNLCHHISLMYPISWNFTLEMNFQFRKEEKPHSTKSGEYRELPPDNYTRPEPLIWVWSANFAKLLILACTFAKFEYKKINSQVEYNESSEF